MDKNNSVQKPFIHPSRAHLFQKPVVPDETFKQSQLKHVGQTWHNRRDRQADIRPDDQLLVFGYASKIFPPNEQSSAIAKNKHMIAWNEDFKLNLLIDRYDCRASLHNLSDFDSDLWNKNYQLSDEDAKLEARLDEERYRALFVEELEEDIRHEEELKRLHASIAKDEPGGGGAEVAYEYEEESGEQYDPTEPTNDEESDQKLFTAPSALAVPEDMEIPQTEKMHAIIEKTALFVSKQGAQMEIVLKAKQSNNSQFLFLQFDHYLNPYYKHMVKRIKEGKYTPGLSQEENKTEEQESSEEESDSDDGSYLHPSLFASAHKKNRPEHEEKTKAIRTVDPDHPLAKLIEKGRQANAIKQYQRMAEAVYNYYQQQGGVYEATSTTSSLEPPPLPTFMTMSGLHATPDTTPSTKLHPTDSVNSAETESEQTTALPSNQLEDYHWNKDAPIVPPPPDLQEVVEEIAKKVAMEGKETEKALICQADADYSFLNPWHELHPYYQFRKMSWLRILYPPPPPDPNVKSDEDGQAEEDKDEENSEDKNSASKSVPPISFSIKARKEGVKKNLPLPNSNATDVLGDVPSDGDEENLEERKVVIKKSKSGRRRFTDHPPNEVETLPENDAPPENVPDDTLTEEVETSLSSSAVHANTNVMMVKPSPISRPTPPAPVSTFTAVTSTGEATSISDLREKQAARRKKALLFLKAKTVAENKDKPLPSQTEPSKNDEQNKLAAIASEDIFDLSAPAEEENANSPPHTENSDEYSSRTQGNFQEQILETTEVILESPPSSSHSSSSDSSSSSPNRSRTPSRSPSGYSHLNSRDLDMLRSQTRSIINDLEKLQKRSRKRHSSSSDGSSEVPSAYRVEKYRKKSSARSAIIRKRSKRRSKDRSGKRHKRSRGESSSTSRKSRRGRKHSSRDKKSKKKKRKSKKTRKIKKKARSSGSSSSSSSSSNDSEIVRVVRNSGLYFDDQDFTTQDRDRNDEERMDVDDPDGDSDANGSKLSTSDVIVEEKSEGELSSD